MCSYTSFTVRMNLRCSAEIRLQKVTELQSSCSPSHTCFCAAELSALTISTEAGAGVAVYI